MSVPVITEHKRGDDFVRRFTLREVIAGQLGAAVSLAGVTGRAQLRDSADLLLQDFEFVITDEPGGVFELRAPRADTELWPLGKHRADVEIDWPDTSFPTSDRRQSTQDFIIHVMQGPTHA